MDAKTDTFGVIDLARAPNFAIGKPRCSPSTLEVVWAERSEILQPRVMQVLICLAEAGGAVVSRDDLVRRCWGGRIVGDDAINRCIAKIRQLATADGAPAFTVETVPRVGYRLSPKEAPPAHRIEAIAPPPPPPRPEHRAATAGAGWPVASSQLRRRPWELGSPGRSLRPSAAWPCFRSPTSLDRPKAELWPAPFRRMLTMCSPGDRPSRSRRARR